MPFKKIQIALLIQCYLCFCIATATGQIREKNALCFISDCQQPLRTEKLIRKERNNIAGRDLLFRDIAKRNQGYLFLLGDMVGKGSKTGEWSGVDTLLNTLRGHGTKVYAIPGNHEYLWSASRGISQFKERFPELSVKGYCVRTDSMAIVLLNSNFRHLSDASLKDQLKWYETVMDSLESDPSVLQIVLCTHHSPFSNSKVVGPTVKVQEAFIPRFRSSPKAKLFITGHSHNLEYFEIAGGKHCLVIGGGGGIYQPLYTGAKEKFRDLVPQETKPRFFYMELSRKGMLFDVTIHGFTGELKPVAEIKLSL
jgi:hypothetical protein